MPMCSDKQFVKLRIRFRFLMQLPNNTCYKATFCYETKMYQKFKIFIIWYTLDKLRYVIIKNYLI